jgi:hypothetical protein
MTVDSYLLGSILIGLTTTISMAGVLLARRTFDDRSLAAAHGLSGNFLTIVGTMYAVLLGLIVVDAMGKFQKAADNVEKEANQLADLVYLGDRMPPDRRREVRRLAIRYAELVRDREWKTMARGTFDPETLRTVLELMAVLRDWEPTTESEKSLYASAVQASTDLWNARRERLLVCSQGIPTLEWFAVILGGMVTIGLTYAFVFEDVRIQLALTALVSLIIALNIYLIVMFGYPFSGDLQVTPASFQQAIEVFKLTAEMTGR